MTTKNLPAQIIELAESRFDKNNPLFDEYISICSTNTDEETHFHKHHILPRSMFPEHVSNTNNIVNLTYADHYRAHEILAQICVYAKDKHKMLIAWNGTRVKTNQTDMSDYELYSELMRGFRKAQSIRMIEWRKNNQDKVKEQSRLLSERHKSDKEFSGMCRQSVIDYWSNNPDKCKEVSDRQKQWWLDNPDALEATSIRTKEWITNNPELYVQKNNKHKQWWLDNPDKLQESIKRSKTWRRDNPTAVKEQSDKKRKFLFEQYTLDGEYLATFNVAELVLAGFHKSHVAYAGDTSYKKHKGFMWKKVGFNNE